MVVDENDGKLLGEVTGIKGAHGAAIVDVGWARLRDRRRRQGNRDVRSEDVQDAGHDPGGRRRRRDHLRRGVAPRASRSTATRTSRPSSIRRPANSSPTSRSAASPNTAPSAGDGKVYINLTDKAEIVEVDAKAATVLRRWPTAPCKNPVSMAIDTKNHRLFSGCRSGVMAVSDYQAGKVVATAADRHRRRRRRLRPGVERCVRLERRRHADGHPPGFTRQIHRDPDAADAAGFAQHGPRSDDAQDLPRGGEVRPGAGKRTRARADGGRIVQPARRVEVDGRRLIAAASAAR